MKQTDDVHTLHVHTGVSKTACRCALRDANGDLELAL